MIKHYKFYVLATFASRLILSALHGKNLIQLNPVARLVRRVILERWDDGADANKILFCNFLQFHVLVRKPKLKIWRAIVLSSLRNLPFPVYIHIE